MYSRNPARFGPIPKSYFNIELYKSEGQTLLDFWTVGYHTFPTREKKEKKNRTRYIEEGTADLLKLLNFSRLFHDCIYFVDKEVYKKFVKLQWMNFCHRRKLWFDVWVFFFDIEGKLWKSRGLWFRRLAEKGLQYSAQCPLILANSNSIAVVYKTQW